MSVPQKKLLPLLRPLIPMQGLEQLHSQYSGWQHAPLYLKSTVNTEWAVWAAVRATR